MSPQELKQVMSHGLLSFPITDFDANNKFNAASYKKRLEWLMPYGATALFAAGGTGEFFSLAQNEYSDVVKAALDTCKGQVPIIAGTGYGTATAIQYAQEAERLGAQGVLLLPHYLTEASPAGIEDHVAAVCAATRLGVIVYNRASCRLGPDALARLADRCPNLVGFKDGIGDIELMVSIYRRMGDRFAYLGGLPTAEIFAQAYKAMGTPVYSSAVFNFIPKTAMDFYNALAKDDNATCNAILDKFFMPYMRIRNRSQGYAVSIIKAGARLVGHDGGKVRSPLTELTEQECADLDALIKLQGSQAI